MIPHVLMCMTSGTSAEAKMVCSCAPCCTMHHKALQCIMCEHSTLGLVIWAPHVLMLLLARDYCRSCWGLCMAWCLCCQVEAEREIKEREIKEREKEKEREMEAQRQQEKEREVEVQRQQALATGEQASAKVHGLSAQVTCKRGFLCVASQVCSNIALPATTVLTWYALLQC